MIVRKYSLSITNEFHLTFQSRIPIEHFTMSSNVYLMFYQDVFCCCYYVLLRENFVTSFRNRLLVYFREGRWFISDRKHSVSLLSSFFFLEHLTLSRYGIFWRVYPCYPHVICYIAHTFCHLHTSSICFA